MQLFVVFLYAFWFQQYLEDDINTDFLGFMKKQSKINPLSLGQQLL